MRIEANGSGVRNLKRQEFTLSFGPGRLMTLQMKETYR
jgi:hypothetical protein